MYHIAVPPLPSMGKHIPKLANFLCGVESDCLVSFANFCKTNFKHIFHNNDKQELSSWLLSYSFCLLLHTYMHTLKLDGANLGLSQQLLAMEVK